MDNDELPDWLNETQNQLRQTAYEQVAEEREHPARHKRVFKDIKQTENGAYVLKHTESNGPMCERYYSTTRYFISPDEQQIFQETSRRQMQAGSTYNLDEQFLEVDRINDQELSELYQKARVEADNDD